MSIFQRIYNKADWTYWDANSDRPQQCRGVRKKIAKVQSSSIAKFIKSGKACSKISRNILKSAETIWHPRHIPNPKIITGFSKNGFWNFRE